jgi:hypothetical protein
MNMMDVIKIVVVLFCLQLTACYPPSPFADCYVAPYNKNEQKIIDSLNKLHINGINCYLSRIHLSNILNNETCEIQEPIYALNYSISDSILFQDKDSLDNISVNLIKNIYLNVMDDTLKAIANRIEVSISCLLNREIRGHCRHIKMNELMDYYGERYLYLMGNLIKVEVPKKKKLQLLHGSRFCDLWID